MAWKTKVLVVANASGNSPELRAALQARAARSPTAFTLVVPATGSGSAGRELAARQLEAALEWNRGVGLELEGQVGDADPMLAVDEVFDAKRFDEVVVATLAPGASRWLQIDLPHRIARLTALPVTHVVARGPQRPLPAVVLPEPEHPGVLAPLKVLTWGPKP